MFAVTLNFTSPSPCPDAGPVVVSQAASLRTDQAHSRLVVIVSEPEPPATGNDELAACAPFLAEQLGVIQPKVVLSLGSVATQALLRTREPIGKLRGRIHPYGAAILIPTFHPAFLLRNPGQDYKRMAWDDLKLAKREYDQRRAR